MRKINQKLLGSGEHVFPIPREMIHVSWICVLMSLRGTTTSLCRGSHQALGKSTYEDSGGRRSGKFVPRRGTQFATSKRFMNGADPPKFIAAIGIRGVVNRLVGGQKTLAQWLRTDLRSDDHRCFWW